eukprot:9493513-Prorocentrum_lima.AAC.1
MVATSSARTGARWRTTREERPSRPPALRGAIWPSRCRTWSTYSVGAGRRARSPSSVGTEMAGEPPTCSVQ